MAPRAARRAGRVHEALGRAGTATASGRTTAASSGPATTGRSSCSVPRATSPPSTRRRRRSPSRRRCTGCWPRTRRTWCGAPTSTPSSSGSPRRSPSVLGWSPAEMVGTRILDHVHPDDLDRVRTATAAANDGGRVSFEARYLCKDDSYRWLEITARPAARRVGRGRRQGRQLPRRALGDRGVARARAERAAIPPGHGVGADRHGHPRPRRAVHRGQRRAVPDARPRAGVAARARHAGPRPPRGRDDLPADAGRRDRRARAVGDRGGAAHQPRPRRRVGAGGRWPCCATTRACHGPSSPSSSTSPRRTSHARRCGSWPRTTRSPSC